MCTLQKCSAANQVNDTGDPYEPGPPQDEVHLLVTLTDLEGQARAVSHGEGINVPAEGCFNGVTVTSRLTSQSTEKDWRRVAELVLGSSAHSAAWEAVPIHVPENNLDSERWEPAAMHESLLVRQRNRRKPPYFVDGGTVTNLPVGGALRMMHRREKGWKHSAHTPFDPQRIVLFVEPDPVVANAQPGDFGLWGKTLKRAAAIYSGSPVPLGDLRWVGETNEEVVHLLKTVVVMAQLLQEQVTVEDGGRVVPFPPRPAIPLEAYGEAAAAAQPLTQQHLLWLDTDPDPKTVFKDESASDECVLELYKWFEEIGSARTGAIWSPEDALSSLMDVLNTSPLGYAGSGGPTGGSHPQVSWREATQRVRGALLELGMVYYSFKQKGQHLVNMLKLIHMWAARQTPAGDRQWVYVTRIVPGDEKPYSRVLGHFGGFLNPEWMRYDYELGRNCAIRWLSDHFPESPYVQSKLKVKPSLPPVSVRQPDPLLWARNAGPIAAVIAQIEKTALEELPWLHSKLARLISQAISWYVVSSLASVAGYLLKVLPYTKVLNEWLFTFLTNYLQETTVKVGAAGLPYALGFAAVYWWSRAGWSGRVRVRVLLFLWAGVHSLKGVFRAFAALRREKPSAGAPVQNG